MSNLAPILILLMSGAPPGDGGADAAGVPADRAAAAAPSASAPSASAASEAARPKAAAPAQGRAQKAAPATAAATDKPRKRWELGAFDVEGTVPKPGVVFVEAEQERLRSVMQTLVAETRAGGFADVEVSRPTELPTRAPRIKHIKARGPLRAGALLKALGPTLPTLQACRVAAQTALPTDVSVSAVLTVDEDGQVTRGELTSTSPTSPRVGHCVLARLKRGAFPPSPVGKVKVELVVVLPPPYAVPARPEDRPQPAEK